MISPAPLCYSLADLDRWQDLQPALMPPARLAVIGDPISHSKSPQMHNPGLAACGIVAQYVRVQVPVGHVAEAFRSFARQGFWGINVTIPHKFEALDAVDVVDPLARTLGAVNTVAIKDGQLHGYNSDGPGFLRSVKEAFGVEARDLRVLILGAGGGAGRAVAMQCALEECKKLYVVNRTVTKLISLASDFADHARKMAEDPQRIQFITDKQWNDRSLSKLTDDVDLIVNGTSVGMQNEDSTWLPTNDLTSKHLVFDMVYRPGGLRTPLGEAAHKAGARYVDGATLLLHQGAISFEHWFQRPAPLDAMRAGLAAALQS